MIAKEVGNLEGITKADNYYYITDWEAGKLLKIHAESGEVTELLTGLINPIDPDYIKELGVIGFPQHATNQVLFVKVGATTN
jgi:hypothetical protein